MPWSNVPDFAPGQVLTADVLNDVKDNTEIGHRVCTSTTRPSSPDEGTMIYETDTDKVFIWDGSAWQQVASNSVASILGGVTVDSLASGGNVSATGTVSGATVSSSGAVSGSSLSISGTSNTGAINVTGDVYATGYITSNSTPFAYGTNPTPGGAYTVPRFTYLYSARSSAYNTGNGRFTCPVAGLYYINVNMIVRTAASGSYYSYFAIYRNGTQYAYTHNNRHTPEWISMGVAACIYCNAGDYLEPYFWSVGGPYYYTGGNHAYYLCTRLV